MRSDGDWTAPRIFADVAADPKRRDPHHQMLLSYARHDYRGVPPILQLDTCRCIIDAGGGLGALSRALVDFYPQLRVLLFDRAEVIDQAKSEFINNKRIATHVGDLFQPWLLQADAVVLARVLHDWDDGDALRILRRARTTLPVGGQLFVVEMTLSPEGFGGSLCDLHLLAVTGGRERTVDQYAALMALSGFTLTEMRELTTLPTVLVGIAQ